ADRFTAITMWDGASGSEIRGMAVRSATTGIAISGVQDVVLEQVWVHDALLRGINVQNTLGPTSIAIRRSLLEDNVHFGIYLSGSEATIEQVVVRNSIPLASEGGRGVSAKDSDSDNAPSKLTLRRSLVENNHDIGVFVGASEATIEGVVVRGTLPRAMDLSGGRGVTIQRDEDGDARSTAIVKSSLIENNRDVGVFLGASEATFEGIVVRGTLPRQSDENTGRGMSLQEGDASVTSSLIEDNHDHGLYIGGASVTVEGVVVRRTLPRPSDQWFGRGIGIGQSTITNVPAIGTVVGSVIAQNYESGVIVVASSATLSGIVVRETLASAYDGTLGDGVVVVTESPLAGAATVTSSRIENNERAGLASFAGDVGLGQTVLSCNAFDLNGELKGGEPFRFENLGGNVCGCAGPIDCAVRTSGLTPPSQPTE
ncbi:MAG TPA: right-handed parallel beta-helix repeat-containing protein, partial [Polyangiaceae bacterium]|nr:right-handed parallel beta-helix repeat-containing protein [Polyangiaceae bacterium]